MLGIWVLSMKQSWIFYALCDNCYLTAYVFGYCSLCKCSCSINFRFISIYHSTCSNIQTLWFSVWLCTQSKIWLGYFSFIYNMEKRMGGRAVVKARSSTSINPCTVQSCKSHLRIWYFSYKRLNFNGLRFVRELFILCTKISHNFIVYHTLTTLTQESNYG